MSANIFHIKPSPKQQDWLAEYAADTDTKLMMDYFKKHDTPMPSDMINGLDRCYRMHLREDRVQFRHQKLIYFLQTCIVQALHQYLGAAI